MYNAFVKIKKKKALALHGANDTTQNCKAENQIDAGIKKKTSTSETKLNIPKVIFNENLMAKTCKYFLN